MKAFLGKQKIVVALLATGTFGLASQTASAAAAVQMMTVTATVGANCIVTANPIAFGVYDPLSVTPLNGTAALVIACTTGAIPAVAVDTGANASGAQRRMANGGIFLNYDVYQPTSTAANAACAYATFYPTVAPGFSLTAAPSVTARSYNICGRIPVSQSVPNAVYTDTVSVTVTF